MNISKSLKTLASISTLCAVMAISSTAYVSASDHESIYNSSKHHHKSGERKHMMKHMTKALSLTDQQQADIKVIKEQAKEQYKSLHESKMQFKQEAKALVHAENFDEQAFIALQGSYQASFEQAGLAKAKTKNAIYNVLTTEQKVKWLEIMAKRKGKMKKVNFVD